MSKFKPKSTSKEAKKIIRDEMKSCGWNARGLKSQIDDFRKYDRRVKDYYSGGQVLVNEGNFAAYFNQTDHMLGKIYGKKNVDKWSNEKKWNTYRHLLSREINAVCKKGSMSVSSTSKKKKRR